MKRKNILTMLEFNIWERKKLFVTVLASGHPMLSDNAADSRDLLIAQVTSAFQAIKKGFNQVLT
jgi:type IV secretory pathway ATPase VirB11/archaellum biosynthesis ATPase